MSILPKSITHSAREQQFLFSIPKHFAVYASREFSERYWFSTSIRNFWRALRVYFECKKWPTAVRGLISHLIKPLNGGSGPATICHYIKWNSAVEKRLRCPRYCCGWITFRIDTLFSRIRKEHFVNKLHRLVFISRLVLFVSRSHKLFKSDSILLRKWCKAINCEIITFKPDTLSQYVCIIK